MGGTGVSVGGTAASADVGTGGVSVGATGVSVGVGPACRCRTVRAKKLSRSTWAVAVDAAKSTLVSKGVQASSWYCCINRFASSEPAATASAALTRTVTVMAFNKDASVVNSNTVWVAV